MSSKAHILIATEVVYYHPNDEAGFFAWLSRIDCVERFEGLGSDLEITLRRTPNISDLQELLAFFHRYRIDMGQLARFETSGNRSWFRDPVKYWHTSVF